MMRDQIFISYRRDDARGASGRLYDWLRIAFGRERVFRDVASIGAGRWRQRIDSALARSVVCLPVIGPRWADDSNGARLHDADDMVRYELVNALTGTAEGLTLIPTLVEGARLPSRDSLPEALRGLLEWNAFILSEAGWEDDVRRLLGAVSESSGQPLAADVDRLLASQRATETRLRDLQQDKRLQVDQVRALTDTVATLTRRLAERADGQRADLAQALADLARGDTGAAEREFQGLLEARSAEAEQAAHEAAIAARHLANLALLNDLDKAVGYYRRATGIEPGNPENWRLLGQACLTTGDTAAAGVALAHALDAARERADIWEEMAAESGLGDIARALGALPAAAGHYTTASRIANEHVARQPSNGAWQRSLSVAWNKLGDIQELLGDDAGATDAYRHALAIREALAARESGNTLWQRDLAVSHGNLGIMLAKHKEHWAALAQFRAGLAVFEGLAGREPDVADWRRDVSVSQEKIGNSLMALGDFAGACDAYRAGLAIREALAERNPSNAEWQRDLSVSHDKIGDALLAQQDRDGALDAYTRGLDIAERLAERDRGNADWQRDLIVSYVKLADATGEPAYAAQALDVAQAMQARGILAPRDAWMLDALARRVRAAGEPQP
jgi:tetratricopeptide (TPR) repeat protein